MFTENETRFMAEMLSSQVDCMDEHDPALSTLVSMMRKLDAAVPGCLVAPYRASYREVKEWLDDQPLT
jgi:hypothetical protein